MIVLESAYKDCRRIIVITAHITRCLDKVEILYLVDSTGAGLRLTRSVTVTAAVLGSALLNPLNVCTFSPVDLQDAVRSEQGDPGSHRQGLQSLPLPLLLGLGLLVLAIGVAVNLPDLRPEVGPVHAETDVALAGHRAAVLLAAEVPDCDATELNPPPSVVVVVLGHHLGQPERVWGGGGVEISERLHGEVARAGLADLLQLVAILLQPLQSWLLIVTATQGMFGRQ